MPLLVPALAVHIGLAALAAGPAATPPGRPCELLQSLEARAPAQRERALDIAAARAPADLSPPPCVADYCQARVEVPGFAPSVGRPHRSELFLALLDSSHIEPIATIAWAFVVTGLRLEWTPPAFDGDPGASRHGWGSVFVRVRLRLSAHNLPAIPERHATGMRLHFPG